MNRTHREAALDGRVFPQHVQDAWSARRVEAFAQQLALGQGAPIAAIVFDAYGTLFDLASIDEACAVLPGVDPRAFAGLWRTKQLEYSVHRSLMGSARWADSGQVTAEALEYALARFGVFPDAPVRAALLSAWATPRPVPDAIPVLAALAPRSSPRRRFTPSAPTASAWPRPRSVSSAPTPGTSSGQGSSASVPAGSTASAGRRTVTGRHRPRLSRHSGSCRGCCCLGEALGVRR